LDNKSGIKLNQMAGVKGKSGGARPGAGRKPAAPTPLSTAPANSAAGSEPTASDPLKFLLDVMNDAAADGKLRVDAAKAALPFVHAKKGEAGKKEAKQEDAAKIASKFGARPAPLKVVGR
jgi:phage terminase small subunit